MKINARAETLGREIVAACIARDLDRVIRGIESIEKVDPRTSTQVLEIYAAVGRGVLFAIFKGGPPSEPQNHKLALEIVASETWTKITQVHAYEVLESLASDHVPQVPPGEAVATLFVVIGYLLAVSCKPLGYATTFELIDALLADLEKM